MLPGHPIDGDRMSEADVNQQSHDSAEVEHEVTRRVRHATGIKFMRDTNKDLDDKARVRKQKPRLIIALVSVAVVLPLLAYLVISIVTRLLH